MSSDSEASIEFEIEQFKVGKFEFSITTVAFMPLTQLLKLTNSSQSNHSEISGQKVWCGSLGLCEYLLSQPSLVEGKLLLELGAGMSFL